MEPVITTIAAAVALGAAAGIKDTASKAVKDAYAGLKTLIQDRYKKNEDVTDAVDYLVKKPEAEGRLLNQKRPRYAGQVGWKFFSGREPDTSRRRTAAW